MDQAMQAANGGRASKYAERKVKRQWA